MTEEERQDVFDLVRRMRKTGLDPYDISPTLNAMIGQLMEIGHMLDDERRLDIARIIYEIVGLDKKLAGSLEMSNFDENSIG
jgi:hypothetical protein